MRIFQFVIPFHERAVLGITAHQLDRFGDNIDNLRTIHGDAVLRLKTEHPFHFLEHSACRGS